MWWYVKLNTPLINVIKSSKYCNNNNKIASCIFNVPWECIKALTKHVVCLNRLKISTFGSYEPLVWLRLYGHVGAIPIYRIRWNIGGEFILADWRIVQRSAKIKSANKSCTQLAPHPSVARGPIACTWMQLMAMLRYFKRRNPRDDTALAFRSPFSLCWRPNTSTRRASALARGIDRR